MNEKMSKRRIQITDLQKQEIEEKLREYASAGATEIAAQIFPETPGDKDSILRSRETLLGPVSYTHLTLPTKA